MLKIVGKQGEIFFAQLNVFYRVKCALLYIENDAEIFPAHYTWKVTEKGVKRPL